MKYRNRIVKGVISDVDHRYQPEGSLRYSKNGYLRSADGRSLLWTSMSGTKLQHTFAQNELILAISPLGEELVVFTTFTSVRSNPDNIYLVTLKSNGDIDSITLKYNGTLNFSSDHPIRAKAYVINDLKKYIYWVDGIDGNRPRGFNIGLSGLLSDPSNVNYIHPDTLDFSPNHTNEQIQFVGHGQGNLLNGVYFYSYQLIAKSGSMSDWSPEFGPISAAMGVVGSYQEHAEYNADNIDVYTGKSINLIIPNIDAGKWNRIRVAAWRAVDKDTIENGMVFYDREIYSSGNIAVTHYGNEAIEQLPAQVLNTITIESARDLTTIHKMLDLVNIKEREQLTSWDPTGTVNYETYNLPVDSRGTPNDLPLWQGTVATIDGPIHGVLNNPSVDNLIYPGIWYYVTGGSILYNGSTYSSGQYFKGVSGVPTMTTINGSVSMAIRIRTNVLNGVPQYFSHVLQDQHPDYKNPLIANLMAGYWGEETYRVGVLLYDLTGKPMFVRHIGDVTLPRRVDSYSMLDVFYKSGDPHYYSKILSLTIAQLDITDIKSQISGFSIVVAPRDKQIKAEGLLYPVRDLGSEETTRVWPTMGCALANSDRLKYWFSLYSPEYLFEAEKYSINKTDKVYLNHHLQSISEQTVDSNFVGFGKLETFNRHFYNKYYTTHYSSTGPANLSSQKKENEIEQSFSVRLNELIYLDNIKSYQNIVKAETVTYGHGGIGMNTVLLKLKYDNTVDMGTDLSFAQYRNKSASYVQIKELKSNLYGGNDDAALANTTYRLVGHYQKVDNSSPNVFYSIQIFGGDCFVNLLDIARVITDDNTTTSQFSQAVIFPVQSEINVALRNGNTINRNRSREGNSGAINDYTGLTTFAERPKLEEFNYNYAMSTFHNGKLYPALPLYFENDTHKPLRHRYSEVRKFNDKYDNMKVFLSNNFVDVDPELGEIVACDSEQSRIYSWQKYGVSYIAVEERQFTVNNLGLPLQLGVGGKFDRNDQIQDYYGCQHTFGVTRVVNGWIWIDTLRKEMLTLNTNGGMATLASELGFLSELEAFCTDGIERADNPLKASISASLSAYFDPRFKYAFFSNGQKTIGFNVSNRVYGGEFEFNMTVGASNRKYFFASDGRFWPNPTDTDEIHLFGHGIKQNYFRNNRQAEMKIVVVPQLNINGSQGPIFSIFQNLDIANKGIVANDSNIMLYFETENQLLQPLLSSMHNENYNNAIHLAIPEVGDFNRVSGYFLVVGIKVLNPNLDYEIYDIETTFKKGL